jgi:hypothetical protein
MPINKYEGQTLDRKTFKLEECWFVNCVLRDCTIFYSGGSYEFENTRFENCQWKFQDEAQRTCVLLSQIGLLKAGPLPLPGPVVSGPVH